MEDVVRRKEIDFEIEKHQPAELNRLLEKFYAEVKNKNGQDYEQDSLRVMIAALDRHTLASGARSKTRPAWQSLARPRFPGFWPSLPGKCGLVKPGKPGHGQVFLATLATKVRLSRPC